LVVALSLVAARALAFDSASGFFEPKGTPHAATYGASAEGVYFTGAPRFASQTCAACHTDGPGRVQLKLGVDQPSLFVDGYTPGVTYLFEVELNGEVEGLQYNTPTCTEPPGPRDTFTYVQCNNNNFALEIESGAGPLSGASLFCSQAPVAGACPTPNAFNDEVVVAPTNDAVFGNRQHDPANPKTVSRNDPTRWHLWWTAPPAGTGPLTLYLAAVDGNGGGGTLDNDQDPLGDDTVQSSFSLQEAGAQVPNGAGAGCAVGGAVHPSLVLGLLGLLALLATAGRWRRATRACSRRR
jgi:hypothetical protein